MTFKEVWAKKIAEGYRYGWDAIEQVKFGWNMAHAEAKKDSVCGLTQTEKDIMNMLLTELRHSCTAGKEIMIRIDPWINEANSGCKIDFTYNELGLEFEFNGSIKKSKKPTKARAVAMKDSKRRK